MPDLDDTARGDRLSVALHGLASNTPAALPLPYQTVRDRGLRRRRRRGIAAAVGTVCAVALLGSGGLLLQGRHGAAPSVVPAITPSGSASPAPSGTPTATAARPPIRVDLARHLVIVGADGATRELPATAGAPAHPTRTGWMTVAGKPGTMGFDFAGSSTEEQYRVSMDWCVQLADRSGYPTYVCGMPFLTGTVFGHENVTHENIGLSTEDARWYFEHVSVGDRVEVSG
ncbi:hypothetical protein GCM10010430_71080 [Kitasatospora cystarginea]|uniref:L,D-TPase catalytic domain-containing protein n=1 Tax=Kitasatospora cystarginea TaxID=58350 RepID=A0ABN3EXJ2_9ACTN